MIYLQVKGSYILKCTAKCFILITLDDLQEAQSQNFFKASFTEAVQTDKLKILKALGKKKIVKTYKIFLIVSIMSKLCWDRS